MAMSTRRKLAIATWPAPHEPSIFGKLTVDATQMLAYIERTRAATGEKVTVTHLVGRAFAAGLRKTPTLNGRIVFGRFVPHATIDVSFLVSVEGGNDLAKAKVVEADTKTPAQIAAELRQQVERLRAGRDASFKKSKGPLKMMPTWLIRPTLALTGFLSGELGLSVPALGVEPFPFGSFVVSNVGVFEVDEAFVPIAPFARVPLLVLVGTVRELPSVVDGKVVPRPLLSINATLDHRFVDGAQAGLLSRTVRTILEDPWQLDARPGTSPDVTEQPRA